MYPKPWICPSGHVLGEVNRLNNVRHLVLFRYAGQPQDVAAVITGPAYGITCSICGCKRNWFIGDEAIHELLEKRGG